MNEKHLNKALSTFLSRYPPKKQAPQLGSAPSAPVSRASPARSSSRHRGTQGVRGRSYPIPTYKIPPRGTDTTSSGQGHRQRGRHSSDSDCSDDQGRRDHSRRPRVRNTSSDSGTSARGYKILPPGTDTTSSGQGHRKRGRYSSDSECSGDQGRRDHSRRPRARSTSSDSGTSARGSASSGQSPATRHGRRHRAPRRSHTQAERRRKDDTSFFSRHTLGITFLAGAVAGVGVSAALRTDTGRKVKEALTCRVRGNSAAPPLTRRSSPRGRSPHPPSPHRRGTSTSDRFGTSGFITSSGPNNGASYWWCPHSVPHP